MFRASQHFAIAVMFLLLAGGILLTVAPYEVGTIRLAGVSLLWWYGVVATPVVTVAVATVSLLAAARRRPAENVTPSAASE